MDRITKFNILLSVTDSTDIERALDEQILKRQSVNSSNSSVLASSKLILSEHRQSEKPTIKVYYIRVKLGESHQLELPILKRVKDIKKEIIEQFNIPVEFDGRDFDWTLESNKRAMDDNLTLRDSNVNEGDTLTLVSRPVPAREEIKLPPMDGLTPDQSERIVFSRPTRALRVLGAFGSIMIILYIALQAYNVNFKKNQRKNYVRLVEMQGESIINELKTLNNKKALILFDDYHERYLDTIANDDFWMLDKDKRIQKLLAKDYSIHRSSIDSADQLPYGLAEPLRSFREARIQCETGSAQEPVSLKKCLLIYENRIKMLDVYSGLLYP
jgi:hypothetical protein